MALRGFGFGTTNGKGAGGAVPIDSVFDGRRRHRRDHHCNESSNMIEDTLCNYLTTGWFFLEPTSKLCYSTCECDEDDERRIGGLRGRNRGACKWLIN
eukprot:scaffold389_cov211-Alexandrium_tamarense.AAC.9